MSAAEYADFERAVEQSTAQPEASEPIETMMRLALEGSNRTIRLWAVKWLFRHRNIHVVEDDNMGTDNATSTAAKDLRR